MSQATISSEIESSRDQLRAAAADTAEFVQEHAEAVHEHLRKVRSYAESNPLITAGIAFAAGALLCTLVRR
jgi:ElaB/YqjD/DUF883 family membrane-anchored ribosome-binding protein